jgi:cell division protein FtsW (lipid II flippase)
MNFKVILYSGLILVCVSILGMVYFHEFSMFEIAFIIGMVLFGVAYAKYPEDVETQELRIKRINKNIQTLNDVLWGKQEK